MVKGSLFISIEGSRGMVVGWGGAKYPTRQSYVTIMLILCTVLKVTNPTYLLQVPNIQITIYYMYKCYRYKYRD